MRTSQLAVDGVSSLGFRTKVLPAASAGATFHDVCSNGKFHGVISVQTPTGSCTTRLDTWARPGSTTRPASAPARAAKCRNTETTSSMSIRASTMRLPVSSASNRATCSFSAASRSATAVSRATRSGVAVPGHGPWSKARRAARTAAMASSAVASGTFATREPSAGHRISRVALSEACLH